MKIGISSASFYPDILTEDSINLMKKIGFDLGEIFLNSPSEYESDFIQKLIKEKDAVDFKIISVHCFTSQFEPFLFDRYKRRRDDMLIYFEKVCQAAQALGASYYTFHGMRYTDPKLLNNDFIAGIYYQLIDICNKYNIKLAQENVSWCMSGDIEFLSMLKEKCGGKLFFTLDIKQAYKAKVEPEKYIRVMGNSIVNLHINDKNAKNVCLLPGKGNVDYKKLFSRLKDVRYSGDAIIEVYKENYSDYSEITKSKKILETIL